MPHPKIAWLGRKSTFKGQSGSIHSGSRREFEYARKEAPTQAIMATEAMKVIAAIATRMR